MIYLGFGIYWNADNEDDYDLHKFVGLQIHIIKRCGLQIPTDGFFYL
jgi:hypothetical protein